MNSFYDMLKKTTSSPYYSQMQRFAEPLKDHLGISHFWYYKISSSGNYTYFGLNSAWNEFCFDPAMLKHFPCLRHPQILQSGINLMKASVDSEYKHILDIAWEKFRINFNINLVKSTPEGMEAFGFATRFNDPHAEQRLLNDLPLLRYFTKIFHEKYKKFFQLLEDNQINLSAHFGQKFYESPYPVIMTQERDKFLHKLGFEAIFSLTPRELDVLKFISNGYPAKYIAQQLHLGHRTIENYIVNLKNKLSCYSKVELIQKAQEIASTGYFDFQN